MDSNITSRSASPCHDSVPSTAPSTPPETDDIRPVVNKDSYRRWRPAYHLMPRSGWMNDPCAPGYKNGEYFVSFQWNPNGPDWADISWGTAFSKDLVNWTVLDEPTLRPDTEYDGQGIFTGCALPETGQSDEPLMVAYTSVNKLPIHHTLPHHQGSESLAIAASYDSGRTWTKLPINPVLPHEPQRLDVTGWRDPFVSTWPSMARTLDLDNKTLFGLMSGGIRSVTPTSFLYTISPSDLTEWKYIGPLADVGLNARLSKWSGDMGRNWEVTNFVTLADDDEPSITRDYLIMGTEGCLPEISESSNLSTQPSRPPRAQLWMSGKIRRHKSSTSDAVSMSYDYGGHLDHGCFYAANSFFDPSSSKQIVWGWIVEDDLCDKLRHEQGWSGMLSLPRELRMQTISHVMRASKGRIEDITNLEYELDDCGTYTVRTLGSQPLRKVQQKLRRRSGVRYAIHPSTALDRLGKSANFSANDVRTTQWELQCSFRLSAHCHTAGLHIDHTADRRLRTTIQFESSTETVMILRPSPSNLREPERLVNTCPETAPHTLFTIQDPLTGLEEQETLDIQVWRDNSVLEVFVNGRTAISTRIYTDEDACSGVRFFAQNRSNAHDEETMLAGARLWDGIGIDLASEESNRFL